MIHFQKTMCALIAATICIFSQANAADLVQNESVSVHISHAEIKDYVEALSTTMSGEKWEGRKSVSTNGETADTIDWINGMTMGAATLITWNDDGNNWFGQTEADGKLFQDEHGNYLRDVVINGSFERENAIALTTSHSTGSAIHREITGNINFKTDNISLNGSFAGNGDVYDNGRSTDWKMKLNGNGRTIDVVYTVRDENVSGHYFAVDTADGKTYDGRLDYKSDEPNFVRDVDFILRNIK